MDTPIVQEPSSKRPRLRLGSFVTPERITIALVGLLALIRLASWLLFWKQAGAIGDPGFKLLVQHWFEGFGYSFVPQLGCASAYRSPGYLFFITLVYLAAGYGNYFVLLFVQNVLVVLAGYLLYRLGWAVSGERRVGWLALLFFMVCPYTFYHYTQYYHTFLSSLLLIFVLWGLYRLEQTKRWKWAVMTGIGVGALAYVQGTILPVMPFLSLWLLWRWRHEWKKAIVAIGVIAITSALVIAPWTYRNWLTFHRFVPLTTDLGFALFKANNPYAYGLNALGYSQEVLGGESIINPDNPLEERYFLTPNIQAALEQHGWYQPSQYLSTWYPRPPGLRDRCDQLSTLSEPDFSAFWVDQSRAWMAAHPTDLIKLQAQKIVQFWWPGLTPSIKSSSQWPEAQSSFVAFAFTSQTVFMVLIDLLALVGVVLMFRGRRASAIAPFLIAFGVFTIMHSFFAGYTKYRIPLDNLVFVLAAIGACHVYDAWRRKRDARAGNQE